MATLRQRVTQLYDRAIRLVMDRDKIDYGAAVRRLNETDPSFYELYAQATRSAAANANAEAVSWDTDRARLEELRRTVKQRWGVTLSDRQCVELMEWIQTKAGNALMSDIGLELKRRGWLK